MGVAAVSYGEVFAAAVRITGVEARELAGDELDMPAHEREK